MRSAYLDVSMPMVAGMAHWPSDPPVSIELYKFPEKGDRSTVSLLHMGSHTGTHMDAPRHFLPGRSGVDEARVEEAAARWLIKQGAVLVGVDGLSIDSYHASKPGAHLAVLEAGKVIVEGLCLNGVEAGRYELICLPLRIKGCDGSPVRALLRRI